MFSLFFGSLGRCLPNDDKVEQNRRLGWTEIEDGKTGFGKHITPAVLVPSPSPEALYGYIRPFSLPYYYLFRLCLNKRPYSGSVFSLEGLGRKRSRDTLGETRGQQGKRRRVSTKQCAKKNAADFKLSPSDATEGGCTSIPIEAFGKQPGRNGGCSCS